MHNSKKFPLSFEKTNGLQSYILTDVQVIKNSSNQARSTSDALRLQILESEQLKRKKRVQDVCDRSESEKKRIPLLKDKAMRFFLIVDDEHKLMYCSVAKVASTTWKKLLMILSGMSNATNYEDVDGMNAHRSLRRLGHYSSKEASYRLRTYKKFMFVRQPFERLLSAFNSKLKRSKWWQLKFGTTIVRRLRPNATNESLTKGHDVTFQVQKSLQVLS